MEIEGGAHLVGHGILLPYTPDGYGSPAAIDGKRDVTVLTPPYAIAVLRAGYQPVLHPSATTTI